MNLEALRQLLEVRLAADLRLEVFMPPVLPHFSPPSDAMAAVPPDPARLESAGPDSLVMRTGMLVPAVLGSWWDMVFGWEGGGGDGREKGKGSTSSRIRRGGGDGGWSGGEGGWRW